MFAVKKKRKKKIQKKRTKLLEQRNLEIGEKKRDTLSASILRLRELCSFFLSFFL